MIHWKPAEEYVEPNWVKLGTELPPTLFWRPKGGATLGFLRDGSFLTRSGSMSVMRKE